jgi:formylglycine-generating enzyme required for sulfatase activity
LPCEKGAGHTGGSNRVIRGGSWNNDASNLRSANRNNNPDNANNNIGFRVALPAQAFRNKPEDRLVSCPAIV